VIEVTDPAGTVTEFKETFTAEVVANPCLTTVLTDVTQTITTSALSQASHTFTNPLLDSASGLNGGDGYTLCGNRVYSLTTP